MIEVTIVEDNKEIRYEIVKMISDIYHNIIITEYEKGTDFLNELKKKKSDIYLLDIELGEDTINGYQLAKAIREIDKSAIIMFMSSHTEYACDAFEVDALRFLTKPLIKEKIKEAMDKALFIVKQNSQSIVLQLKNVQKRIVIKDILYIESMLRKMYIKMLDGTVYEHYGTMEEMEKQLNKEAFVRVHRSYIVSMYYINTIKSEKIILDSGETIGIGRKYKETFRKQYIEYIQKRI